MTGTLLLSAPRRKERLVPACRAPLSPPAGLELFCPGEVGEDVVALVTRPGMVSNAAGGADPARRPDEQFGRMAYGFLLDQLWRPQERERAGRATDGLHGELRSMVASEAPMRVDGAALLPRCSSSPEWREPERKNDDGDQRKQARATGTSHGVSATPAWTPRNPSSYIYISALSGGSCK